MEQNIKKLIKVVKLYLIEDLRVVTIVTVQMAVHSLTLDPLLGEAGSHIKAMPTQHAVC